MLYEVITQLFVILPPTLLTHPRWSIGTFLRTIARHGVPHFENTTAERGTSLIAKNVERDFSGREYLDWEAIRRMRRRWKGTLVLKGILHPDDARRAGEIGIDGLIVSNHGVITSYSIHYTKLYECWCTPR